MKIEIFLLRVEASLAIVNKEFKSHSTGYLGARSLCSRVPCPYPTGSKSPLTLRAQMRPHCHLSWRMPPLSTPSAGKQNKVCLISDAVLSNNLNGFSLRINSFWKKIYHSSERLHRGLEGTGAIWKDLPWDKLTNVCWDEWAVPWLTMAT